MKVKKFIYIFLQLIITVFIFSFVNIFASNSQIKIRQCCKCRSCKEEDNRIIKNKCVKQLKAVEGIKITYKDDKGNTKEYINDSDKIEKFIEDAKKKNYNIESKISLDLPAEEYFKTKEDSISNSCEREVMRKISKCPIEKKDGKCDDNKTLEFETIKEISKESIEILKNIHTERKKIAPNYLKNEKDELTYHYIRYVVRGNIINKLKNLLFGKYEGIEYWQIEVLGKRNYGEENKDITSESDENNILKKIKFSRITNKQLIKSKHNVENTFTFTKNTEDSFVCIVNSEAKYENDTNLFSLNGFLNKVGNLAGMIPDVYTDIVYHAKYDKKTNTTFFITLGTFHYKSKKVEFIENQIKEQAKNQFTGILGEEFSKKIEEIAKAKEEEEIK